MHRSGTFLSLYLTVEVARKAIGKLLSEDALFLAFAQGASYDPAATAAVAAAIRAVEPIFTGSGANA